MFEIYCMLKFDYTQYKELSFISLKYRNYVFLLIYIFYLYLYPYNFLKGYFVYSCYNGKYSSYWEYVVEMGYNTVCIMKDDINGWISEDYSR